jgi:anti-sigma regulatory factor (Ser/Thr protein kinase)
MTERAGNAAETRALLLRLSVPAQGGLRALAAEVATKIAAHLGSDLVDAESVGTTLEELANHVAPAGTQGEITFEFSELDRALLIRARCDGRSSEARCALPA